MNMNRASPDANRYAVTSAGTPGEAPNVPDRVTTSPQDPCPGAGRARRGNKSELPIKKRPQCLGLARIEK